MDQRRFRANLYADLGASPGFTENDFVGQRLRIGSRLEITVLPHPRYERKGDNLLLTVPVPLYTALLGGEVRVPTLRGTQLAVRIPPEIDSQLIPPRLGVLP